MFVAGEMSARLDGLAVPSQRTGAEICHRRAANLSAVRIRTPSETSRGSGTPPGLENPAKANAGETSWMYFVLSKLLWTLTAPSNVIALIIAAGVVVSATRFRRV
jgi:hypothetical protein